MRIEKYLERFDDGLERYNNDPLFRKVIDSLMYGHEPLKLLDQVLKICREQSKQIAILEESKPVQYVIENVSQKMLAELIKNSNNTQQ